MKTHDEISSEILPTSFLKRKLTPLGFNLRLLIFFLIIPSFLVGQGNIPDPIAQSGTGQPKTTDEQSGGSYGLVIENGGYWDSTGIQVYNDPAIIYGFDPEEEIIAQQEIGNIKDQFLLFCSIGLVILAFSLYKNSSRIYRRAHAIQLWRIKDIFSKTKGKNEESDQNTEKLIREEERISDELGIGASFYIIALLMLGFWWIWIPTLRGYSAPFNGEEAFNIFYLELMYHPRDYALILLLIAFLGIAFSTMKYYQSYSGKTAETEAEKSLSRISVRGLILGLISLFADLIAIGLFLFTN